VEDAAIELDDADDEPDADRPPPAEALLAVWPDVLEERDAVDADVAFTGAPPAPVPEDDATITVLPQAAAVSAGVIATITTRAVEDFMAARSSVPMKLGAEPFTVTLSMNEPSAMLPHAPLEPSGLPLEP
jgi:hypothetical protein